MSYENPVQVQLSLEEYQSLQQLRERKPAQNPPRPALTVGNQVSDVVAATVGSWRFILVQSALLTLWIILNLTAWMGHWDPYPFILLNLVLSFQAAFTAPIIMMSQNRQSEVDRQHAEHDYQVNVKAELEIELLHHKLNLLKEQELTALIQLVKEQQTQLTRLEERLLGNLPNPNSHPQE
ncbi:DUF1003 domain-containing protein [Anthocerotibacter panamensis]|uniref:DUF1003 domain-containing protein n=1 Tax=Anthocerotibacter panamensis TaxID=2857077 RepID=UPI001C407D43|nr:DUF1003 domain-containing protein [Anthocerotibacter panamensis]